MKISQFSISRPVFTMMATFLVMILGGIALWRIPIDLMPDITYPRLSISTNYENASPEEVEKLITRPIEEAVSAVTGIDEITSTSGEGSSRVSVSFTWGTNIDAAANDVRDRLDRIVANLPEEAERPSLRKFDLASFPILVLGIGSRLDPTLLRIIVDKQVKFRLERAPGVAAVSVEGGNEREIHVNLHIHKLKALGVPIAKIIQQIRSANIELPAGSINRGYMDIRIRTPGTYTDLEQLKNTIIAVHKGIPVRLKELAQVEDSWKKHSALVRINGKPGIRLSINKQSGANTVEAARSVMREVEKINQDIPQITISPIIDTSEYIEHSISNISSSAVYGGLLAALVLIVLLRNIRSALIVTTSIPISVIATFLLIYFNGFTLNIMTIGGLALGIGMLVDNSIVVIENITRLRDSGLSLKDASIEGSSEVTTAIVASTITTLVVFLPLIFIRGMAGIMFKQLALVVAFSLLCSLAVALSLVPMLSSRLLEAREKKESRGLLYRFFQASQSFFSALEESYRQLLHWSLDHRGLVIIFCILLLGSSLALAPLVGTELMPATDEGEVRVLGEMEVGTRVEVVDDKFQQIFDIVTKRVPEMKSSVAYIGGKPWRPGESNTGELRISLKSRKDRQRSDEQIAMDLIKDLGDIPGMKIRTRKGQGLFLLRMATRGMERISVEIRGHDLPTADALARQVSALIEQIPGVTDSKGSREAGTPEELIMIDRSKAEQMKLSVSQIGETLRTVLSGTSAGEYREGGDEYRILVKVNDSENLSLQEILGLSITNADGQPVMLRNVVEMHPRIGPVMIERKDQGRIVEIRANIRGRDMGSIVADIRKELRRIAVPRDFAIVFGGDYQEQQKAFWELIISFALAIVLVYMVMACQFESLRDPFVVMFSAPLAAIGVIVMLFMTDTTFNLQSFIGCIMLAGIVVNNAILLVDHTNLLRYRDKFNMREAIEEAGRRRLRPILMTAATTILGLVPLALGWGEGGEAQAPMARAVIGGLVSSTLITLVLIPVVYSFAESSSKATPKK